MCVAYSWILAACFIAGASPSQNWLPDYGEALEATRQSQRPLLIVIDQQPKWLAHIEPVSEVGQPVPVSLLQKYTLCHVDATTPYGKAVAQAFRAPTLPATVIIDKTGAVQLAKKTGRLSASALTSMLTAHQAGERPVATPRPTACNT